MKRPRISREAIISSIVLVIVFVGIVISENKIYLPMERANAYVVSIEPSIKALKESVSELSQSAQSPLFNNPDLTSEQKLMAISQIEELIARVNDDLNQAGTYSTNLGPLELAEPLGLTKQASEIRKQLPYSISQTSEVVAAYAEVITYIKQRHILDSQLSARLQAFNSIQNFDLLINQSSTWMEEKQATDQLLTQLRSLIVPAGFDAVQSEAIRTYTRASSDFGQFATILLTPSEVALDAIARDIEAATEQHENVDANSLFDTFNTSPTLSDIAQLSDKFERY